MMRTFFAIVWTILIVVLGASVKVKAQEASTGHSAEEAPQTVAVQWDRVLKTSRANATLQAVVTPLMARDSRLHDQVWGALKDLHANYVRYVPWLPYPKLAVAELQPPANGKTSWDFSLIDPLTVDFFNANPQVPVVVNFSTIHNGCFAPTNRSRIPPTRTILFGTTRRGQNFVIRA
jgi:predicted secreted protein